MVTVTAVNDAPEFSSTAVTAVDEDALYSYAIVATDADGTSGLSITATTKPDWLDLTDNGSGSATLSGTPTNAEVGSHQVVLSVSDGEADAVTQSFTVVVANVNDAPSFDSSNPIAAITLCPESTSDAVELASHVVDVDAGDSFTFEQSSTPIDGVTVNISEQGQLTVTHQASSAGSFDITLTVRDAAGATGSTTVSVTIEYLAVVISANGNVLSAPAGGDTYQWNHNGDPVGTAQNYTANSVGTYTVTVTYGNGCSATSAGFEVDNLTALQLEDISGSVATYPNPMQQLLRIESKTPINGTVVLQLIDLQGRVVISKDHFENELDVSDLPKGVYLLQLIHDGKRAVKRVVKQ
jgi:hypothetical protein